MFVSADQPTHTQCMLVFWEPKLEVYTALLECELFDLNIAFCTQSALSSAHSTNTDASNPEQEPDTLINLVA